MDDYSTEISITITDSGGCNLSDLNPLTTRWRTAMTDCDVHAWFKLFEQILRSQGFSDYLIMRGATQLAFSEMRDPQLIRKVAHEYDLILGEQA